MTRYIKRGGQIWIRIFPDKPVTMRPAETRMGSGKGNPEFWVAVVKPGRILFEMGGEETQSCTNTCQPAHKEATIMSSLTSKSQHPNLQNQPSLILPPAPAPKLSSVDDFLLESDDALTVEIPGKIGSMSGVRQLQQKFGQHTRTLEPKLKTHTLQKKGQGSEENGGSGGKVTPLVPEEVMSQLMHKPG